ncbi:MAG TPA: hypothetical protein PKA61_10515 [Nitrospira sp.]|nr:hypothetical protein [Nitrospira sp.]
MPNRSAGEEVGRAADAAAVQDAPSVPIPSTFALNALLLLFLVNFTLQPLTEPDFGWHLRAGLDLLQNGLPLPAFDPYSHTMPDWPWVEHAWLTDVTIGTLYASWAGGLGVIVLFGAVATGAWLLAAGAAPAPRHARWLAATLSIWVALPYLGARTQLVSWLGLALLLRLLSAPARSAQRWIPPLFLLWANLHGGFVLGLALMSVIAVALWSMRLLHTKTKWASRFWPMDESGYAQAELRRLVLLTAASAFVTLANPYGWRLHGEIIDSLSNQFMVDELQEWQPLSLATTAGRGYVLYLAALGVAMCCWYRRCEPVRWAVWLAFLWVSLRHMRNVPVFLVVSLPLAAELTAVAFDRLNRLLGAGARATRLGMLAGAVVAALLLTWEGPDHLHHVIQSGTEPARYFQGTSYPIEAVEWIKMHPAQAGARLYNDYGSGGFLLWWMPEHKIFIDGRMPAWRIGDRRIFQDYVALTRSEPVDLSVLEKYAVDWALVRRETPLDRALHRETRWVRIYEDEKVSLYVVP